MLTPPHHHLLTQFLKTEQTEGCHFEIGIKVVLKLEFVRYLICVCVIKKNQAQTMRCFIGYNQVLTTLIKPLLFVAHHKVI